MAFGKPAIATPNRVDLRAVQGAIMSARQRIEFLEAAVTVLQALPNSSAAQITHSRTLAANVREVGTTARKDIERLLGQRVYLDLHVKVAKDWQRDPKQLQRLGF